ncbi:hypothetical protein ACVLV4_000444 [Rathayibacter agropyri]
MNNHRNRVGAVVLLSCIITSAAAPIAAANQPSSSSFSASQLTASSEAFTSVTFDKTEATIGEQVIASLPFTVSDDARAGDSVKVILPAELDPKGVLPFAVKAPDGGEIGTAAWTDNNRAVTLTYGEYVEAHENTAGEIRIATQWNPRVYSEQPSAYTLTFTTGTGGAFSAPLNFRPAITGAPVDVLDRDLMHNMTWTSNLEGGVTGRDALTMYTSLPASPTGFKDGLTAVVTIRPDAQFDCERVDLPGVQVLSQGPGKPFGPMDPSRFSITCSTTTVTVKVPTVAPGEFIDVQIPGSITDVSKKTYFSDVVVTGSDYSGTAEASVKRSTGDGDGEGFQGVTIGDTVFNDLNANGIQDAGEPGLPNVLLALTRTDGQPAVTLDGAPANRVATGSDGQYGFFNFPALPAGASYVVAWTPDPGYDGLAEFRSTTPIVRETSPAPQEADNSVDFGFTRAVAPEPPVVVPPVTEPPVVVPPVTEPPVVVPPVTEPPVAEQAAPAAPAPEAPADALASTGFNTSPVIAMTASLLMAGSFLMILARRRRSRS